MIIIKVWIGSSLLIFTATQIILLIKKAMLPQSLSRLITEDPIRNFFATIMLLIKCFVPILNIIILIGAIIVNLENQIYQSIATQLGRR